MIPGPSFERRAFLFIGVGGVVWVCDPNCDGEASEWTPEGVRTRSYRKRGRQHTRVCPRLVCAEWESGVAARSLFGALWPPWCLALSWSGSIPACPLALVLAHLGPFPLSPLSSSLLLSYNSTVCGLDPTTSRFSYLFCSFSPSVRT
jgi:hypothetical protein